MHQESTIDLVMRNQASLSTHQNHGLHDIVSRIEDSVAGMQSIFFFSFILHSVVHFLTHRLDVVERGVPRIVDLQAAKSVPKTEWSNMKRVLFSILAFYEENHMLC